MRKTILALLTSSIVAISPAAAQIGAPGATDWVKSPLPPSTSPFDATVPPERAADYASIVNLMSVDRRVKRTPLAG